MSNPPAPCWTIVAKEAWIFALVGGFCYQDLPAKVSTSLLRVFHLEFDCRGIEQRDDGGRLGYQRVQLLQPLGDQTGSGEDDACDVAARPVEAGDEAGTDRIAAAHEDDRDLRGCSHARLHCKNIPDDDGRPATNEIDRQAGQSIEFIVAPAIIDGNVLGPQRIRPPPDLAAMR
jgi:hypothetical protein